MTVIGADRIRARIRAAPSRSVPALRPIRRALSRELAGLSGREVLALLEELDGLAPEVPRWLGYELAFHHEAALEALSATRLERLGRGLSSWGDVDPFGCYLSGPAWERGRIDDRRVLRWAGSPNRWWRRIALVSTVPLNRRGHAAPLRTLAVCERLVADRDEMVVKAMSWALRALGVRDPASVRKFLGQHGPALAARVRREVTHKLDTGRKP
ncbi:MAG: DNA alkylation repair protein [Gemmatimonadales bacterium]